MLAEKTVKIIKKVAKDRNSQINWNPELRKGIGNGMRNEEHLQEMQTRKHFQEVAKTVAVISDTAKRQEFANHHAKIFAKDNPKFDHKKFHQACGTLHEGAVTEELLKEGAAKEMSKLFPELKDSPETHRQRMVHSVTRYDRKEEEKSHKDKRHYHNMYALGHYLGAVDRAHEDMSKGMHVKDAINNNFNGRLAAHLHKHCGSDGCVKEAVSTFDENKVRYGVSNSLIEVVKGVMKKKVKKNDDEAEA